MAPHSSTLAWKIPWMEEPGGLQSLGLLRVRHSWTTSLSLFTSCTGEGNGNPLQYSCLENPSDGGAWWAAIYGVSQSWTRLKQLSSSSSSNSSFQIGSQPGQHPDWERLRAGGEGCDRGLDDWMASLTQWTWVWDSEGQLSLACCSPWNHKGLDTTKRLTNNKTLIREISALISFRWELWNNEGVLL